MKSKDWVLLKTSQVTIFPSIFLKMFSKKNKHFIHYRVVVIAAFNVEIKVFFSQYVFGVIGSLYINAQSVVCVASDCIPSCSDTNCFV